MRIAYIGKMKGKAYESVAIDDTVGGKGFTASNITDCKRAYITIETASIRFRYDGTAPTATEGHLLYPRDILIIEGFSNLENFRAIRSSGISGVLKCSFER